MSHSRLRRVAAAVALVCTSPLLQGGVGPRQNFEERLLAAHNRERDAMGTTPLRWDPSLERSAREWARYLARTGKFEHSPEDPWWSEPEGENLWAGTVGRFQPESMVGLWKAEKRDFKAGVFPNNSRSGRVEDVGHYTQLIWARTGAVGCALERGQREDVLVCRYSEAGNVLGERPI
ncbi:MAG: SCP-like extracellular [Sphingomonas sp.]|nr:SCP-like extracellular [Sphingomonas sp.]